MPRETRRITRSTNPRRSPTRRPFVPYPYGLGTAWAEIDIDDSRASQTQDFVLRPVEQRNVSGLIVDPGGKPVTKARYYGMFDIQYWYPVERTNRFTVGESRSPQATHSAAIVSDSRPRRAGQIPHTGRDTAGGDSWTKPSTLPGSPRSAGAHPIQSGCSFSSGAA